MSIFVKKPGLSTTVQDIGRTGHLSSGFSPNGAMDRHAASVANILVGNARNASLLEFVMTGPTLRFAKQTFIALTGADFNAELNGDPVPLNQAVPVPAGSLLTCNAAASGMFGYLAFAGGGLNVPLVMGSASTNLKCGIGGWNGRALAYGDCLPLCRDASFLPNLPARKANEAIASKEGETLAIRVVPGPQEGLFTEAGIAAFYGETYRTTSKSDRMGYRLDGPVIETRNGSDIASDGIAFGAVQVPAHGRPIVMLADRQTTGGYAKIGTVASVDIPKLVQSRPGQEISFTRITVQEAQKLYREEELALRSLEQALQNPGAQARNIRHAAASIEPLLKEHAQPDPTWLNRALAKE